MPFDKLAGEFAGRVHSLVIYVREPHPGERYPMHTSFEQKCAHAREMVKVDKLGRRVLVDSLDGAVHKAFGAWPNMCVVLDAEGRIVLRQRWSDPKVVRETLLCLVNRAPVVPRSTREMRIQGPLLRVVLRSGPTALLDVLRGMPPAYAIRRLLESVAASLKIR